MVHRVKTPAAQKARQHGRVNGSAVADDVRPVEQDARIGRHGKRHAAQAIRLSEAQPADFDVLPRPLPKAGIPADEQRDVRIRREAPQHFEIAHGAAAGNPGISLAVVGVIRQPRFSISRQKRPPLLFPIQIRRPECDSLSRGEWKSPFSRTPARSPNQGANPFLRPH